MDLSPSGEGWNALHLAGGGAAAAEGIAMRVGEADLLTLEGKVGANAFENKLEGGVLLNPAPAPRCESYLHTVWA